MVLAPGGAAWAGVGEGVASFGSKVVAGPAVSGSSGGQGAGVTQGAGISLEQAIGVAKQFIQVPDDYKNFQPNYSENEQQGAFWDLRWDRGTQDGSSIYARVNATTAELWGFSRWEPGQAADTGRGQPKLTRAEAQVRAETWLKKVLPNYYDRLRIIPDADQGLYLGLRQSNAQYSYNFIRLENGVPFPENYANIQVDARSGDATNFNMNWEQRLEFPKPEGVLPSDRALSLWRSNARVALGYVASAQTGRLDKIPVRLVYLPDSRNIMIDARTGEALKPDAYYGYDRSMMGGGGGEGMKSMPQAAPLTPAEQSALAELGKLITRDQALAIATSLVAAPAGYVLQGSSLQQEYLSGRKTWSFNWRGPDNQSFLSVQIDAGQGQLMSFYIYYPELDQPGTTSLNESQARDLAGQFLDRVAGGYLKQLEALKTLPEPPVKPLTDKPATPVRLNFEARRLVDGIPFVANGVNLSVDTVRGRIVSYQLNWWEAEFPEAKGVIGQAGAEDVFLGGGMELSYRRVATDYGKGSDLYSQPVRLVYALKEAPVYVDAFNGIALADDLQPLTKPGQLAFGDLAGQPAAEAVNLLARSKIIPVYEPNFHPQSGLSQRDWLIWLVRATGWQVASAGDPDRDYEQAYNQALAQGILKQEDRYQPQDGLSQAAMARTVIRSLGWEEVAGFQGIWSLPPVPPGGVGKVTAADQGYLSLVQGLGLIDLREASFDPKAVLTRAEGALALYRILN